MARARNIKPGFFKNEELANLSFEARLFFIGLWTLADREGRLEDRPKRMKMELFPADNVDVEGCLTALEGGKFIHRYQVGESKYIQILNFVKHQNPHHKEAPSTIPASEAYPSQTPVKSGANPSDSLIPESPLLIPESVLAWAKSKGFEHPSLQAHWEYFRDYLKSNPVKAKQYRDLEAAFRNCVRSDWGNIRQNWRANGAVASKPWFLNGWSAIVSKGEQFGIKESAYDSPPEFRAAVLKAAGITPEMVKQAEAMAK